MHPLPTAQPTAAADAKNRRLEKPRFSFRRTIGLLYAMDLFSDLTWRGLVNQTTHPEQLGPWLAAGQRTLYAGFDPTSDSLHVGSLLPAMTLRRLSKGGPPAGATLRGAEGKVRGPP